MPGGSVEARQGWAMALERAHRIPFPELWNGDDASSPPGWAMSREGGLGIGMPSYVPTRRRYIPSERRAHGFGLRRTARPREACFCRASLHCGTLRPRGEGSRFIESERAQASRRSVSLFRFRGGWQSQYWDFGVPPAGQRSVPATLEKDLGLAGGNVRQRLRPGSTTSASCGGTRRAGVRARHSKGHVVKSSCGGSVDEEIERAVCGDGLDVSIHGA